ncbi:MAG: hypothetical protein V1493_05180 [Candidatus Diapherotrites archaeon]
MWKNLSKTARLFLIFGAFAIGLALAMLLPSGTSNQKQPDCNSFSVEACPAECVVCPPGEVCSSIACGSEEFCKSIGFDKNWYAPIKERLG